MIKIFERDYSSESIIDLESDMYDMFGDNTEIPQDEHGFLKGTFRVSVTWIDEDYTE